MDETFGRGEGGFGLAFGSGVAGKRTAQLAIRLASESDGAVVSITGWLAAVDVPSA